MREKHENVGKISVRDALLSILLIITAACYMPLFMYFSNAAEAKFSDLWLFLLGFSAGGVVLMLLMMIYTKNLFKSALIAALAMLMFTNYTLLEKLIKLIPYHFRYWHITLFLLFVLIHIAFLVKAKLAEENARVASLILLLVFLLLTVVNGVTAAPAIVEKAVYRPVQHGDTIEGVQQGSVSAEGGPNIYYFIFDEFSAKDVAEKYYDYSNEGFFTGLENLGFVVSYDSKNMSSSTITITTNYVSYDYVVTDSDSITRKRDIQMSNPTVALMQKHGYQIRGVGAEAYGINESGVEVTATTQGGETLQELIVGNTALYILNSTNQTEKMKIRNRVFEYFENPSEFIEEVPQFTMVYLECPHEPFLFSEDGSMVNPKNYYNWENPEYYLAQYKYISKRILETAETIVKNDPTSIIILQSDHSARWMSSIQNEDKTHILNAVYYGGTGFDEFVGKSGVNTLRTIYSSLFDINLPDVEVVE